MKCTNGRSAHIFFLCLFLSSTYIYNQAPPLSVTSPVGSTTINRLPAKLYNTSSMITNDITDKDLGVFKMFAWHYPKKFKVWVNGKELQPGKSLSIPNGKVEVDYAYEWRWPGNVRAGKKRVLYKTVPDHHNYNIVFKDWIKGPNRIGITNAKQISQERDIQ